MREKVLIIFDELFHKNCDNCKSNCKNCEIKKIKNKIQFIKSVSNAKEKKYLEQNMIF